MRVLGIESSCDETGLAIYDTDRGLLAHALHSQVDLHAAYGGVVPELASRDHIKRIVPLLDRVLRDSNCSLNDIDAIAVTEGPGLGGALLVGNASAAALSVALSKPVVGIHHLEGHLLSPLLAETAPAFPFVALLVSGGHTQLMDVAGVGRYQLLGETVDDAAGEAFDKAASILGLGYPGGPALADLAASGSVGRYPLPRPMLHSGNLDFSFSGLKTAVVTLVNRLAPLSEQVRADIAASFEAAIVEVLVQKSLSALRASNRHELVVAGGVGANQRLRQTLTLAAEAVGAKVYYPPLALCTDNGAMIAFAGAMRLKAGGFPVSATRLGSAGLASATKHGAFSVRPRWPLTLA
jgi:N6-L-threonylcarbamoyladenine synthase